MRIIQLCYGIPQIAVTTSDLHLGYFNIIINNIIQFITYLYTMRRTKNYVPKIESKCYLKELRIMINRK